MEAKNNHLQNQQVYWLLQLGGWFTYWLVSTLINILLNGGGSNRQQLWQEQIGITIFFIIGLSATHLYRNYVKRHNWFSLPIVVLIKKLITSLVFMSVAMLFASLVSLYIFGVVVLADFTNTLLIIRVFINTSIIISLWIAIYFSVQYFQNYRQAELQKLKQEAFIKEATLNKLRSQLNPHFIFNSLNSIRALVTAEPNKARDSITALSNIIRKTLQLDQHAEVSFKEEMQIVEDYLQLEKIRFEERLDYSFEIDKEAYQIKIPPLMLQTLVENGIKHGISTLTKGGVLKLTVRSFATFTQIEIRNTGQIKEPGERKGYGLENTRERLRLLYADSAMITLDEEDENTVLTTLIIPKNHNHD